MKLCLRWLRALPLLAFAAVAATSGCAAPTDDDADEGTPIPGEPDAPADPEDTEENIGTAESAASVGCSAPGPGAQLVRAYRSGNFNWVTVLRDTRRDGHAPNVRVEITDMDTVWAGHHRKVYTHRHSRGCGTSGERRYHIDPPICPRSGSANLRVRMWLRNGTRTVSTREVWTKIDCVS